MHANVYINSIRQITGTNEKLKFLKEYLSPVLERIFHLALSSEYTYGIKKIPLYSVGTHTYSLHDALDILQLEFARNEVTGNARIDRLKDLLSHTDPDTAEVVKLILNKSLDCGISVTNANKVLNNPIPKFDVLLCSKQDQKLIDKLPFPGTAVQTKMDGMRVIVTVDTHRNVRYRTRNGKEFFLPEPYDVYFERFPGLVFDGEMLIAADVGIGYLDRKSGNGLLNSIRQGKASEEDAMRVRFVFWDLISYNHYMTGYDFTKYDDRYENLYTLSMEAPNKFIWDIVETKFPKSFEEAQEFYLVKRAYGHEGAILKDLSAPWEAKRVKHHVKMKAEETIDLRVIDWIEGTGKYKGMLGSLVCRDLSNRLQVNVGSGFDDNDRKTITSESIINKIVEIKYNEVITNANDDTLSLFLPIFENVREDKTEPDSI